MTFPYVLGRYGPRSKSATLQIKPTFSPKLFMVRALYSSECAPAHVELRGISVRPDVVPLHY